MTSSTRCDRSVASLGPYPPCSGRCAGRGSDVIDGGNGRDLILGQRGTCDDGADDDRAEVMDNGTFDGDTGNDAVTTYGGGTCIDVEEWLPSGAVGSPSSGPSGCVAITS